MKRVIVWLAGLCLVLFTLSLPLLRLSAADFQASDSTGNVKLDSSVVSRNLFVAGNEIIVQAKEIKKDLFAIGQDIMLDTQVEQGSFIAGRKITIKGSYGGNLFIAGEDVTIDAEVSGDIFLACNRWTVKSDAKIQGDIHVVGSIGYMDGNVSGSIYGACNEWYINGKVEKTVKISAGKTLTIGEKANLNVLEYKALEKATIMDGAVIIKTIFEDIKKEEGKPIKKTTYRFPVISFLASLLFALILVFWFKKPVRIVVNNMQHQFMACLGIGFAVLIGTPIVIMLFFLTFIGYKVALAIMLIYFLLLLCMSVIGAIWLGELISKLFSRSAILPTWLGAIIGVTLIQFINWIPYAGGFIILFLSIVSLGGITITLFQKLRTINQD